MPDPTNDVDLRERQLFAAPGVGCRDHPVLVTPQDQRGDRAELREGTVDADAELLPAGQERSRLTPAPRLVRPDDRARGERARACPESMTDEPRDESRVIPPTAPNEDPPDRGRAQHARPEKRATEEGNAVQLVDPVQRDTETDRSDEDEPAHELRMTDGEVHRDAAAE